MKRRTTIKDSWRHKIPGCAKAQTQGRGFCRKGELTTQQIVGLIILIVSFAVILILIFKLNLGEETNKEICHNSVLLKDKSVIGGELDCRTSYVCISGGGECEGINPTETIEIDLNQEPDKIKNDTMKAIAEEMADCWWMFGEGKVDYIGGIHFTGNKACALCSKISFDEKIINDGGLGDEIPYEDFYKDFLDKESKDKTQTYLEYLDIDDVEKIGGSYLDNKINFENNYYILTGIRDKGALGFFDFPDLPEFGVSFEKGEKEFRRHLQVSIFEQISEAGCSEFVTKA